ncbi:hypothetical protein [Mycolicibacterium stellerae]|uniref:hypothetical protein n=1 Tax=Mycolicibacterium stellerae TaxID=2358193 RepID=UPI0013DE5000|nr:hypothetical protein [Mycolicibacterium stellerae]
MSHTPAYFAPLMMSSLVPVAGDRVRVAHGVFGRLGRVSSTTPGHIVVQYDRGGREIIDQTRRSVWVLQ